MIKAPENLKPWGRVSSYHHIRKTIYNKPKIMLTGEKLEAFLLKSGISQGGPLSTPVPYSLMS